MKSSDSPAKTLPVVQLFTDGACSGNPGPGGWAFVLRHPSTGKEKEGSGGMGLTTNNQMELSAVIHGLKALRHRTRVEVITDSTYVAKGALEWMPNWKKNGWRRKEKSRWKPVKNVELWQQLDELICRHQVKFTIIKGHNGHPENERCDGLAVAAAARFKAALDTNENPVAEESNDLW